MLSAFILSQILIGFAFAFDLASFQFKRRQYTLVCFGISAALISAHFFLLGAITAGSVVAVSVLRFTVAYFTTDKRVMYLFLVVVASLGIYTFDGLEDILITLALMSATIASFVPNERHLRHFMMVGTSFTILHNIIIFTPAGVALEVFFLISNLLSYWRFYLRKSADGQHTTNSLQNPEG